MATISKQKEEAISRLEKLKETLGINPNLIKYFKEDRLYYSYLTGGGFIGSIDTITYDARYAALVEAFQKQTGTLVYHAIETQSTLALLYVSSNEEQWLFEKTEDANWIFAFVYSFNDNYGEYGMIELTSYQGALVRIG